MKLHKHHKLDIGEDPVVTPVHLNFKLTSETDFEELLEVRS